MIFRIRNMGTAKTVSEVKIMPLTKMEAENFTVFEKISIPFCRVERTSRRKWSGENACYEDCVCCVSSIKA